MPTFRYDLDYYDKGIGGFHAASFRAITDRFLAATGGQRIDSVLDMGCGGGFYGPFLKGRADVIDGVDGSNALEQSPSRANYDSFVRTDLGAEWRPTREYDVVFSIEVIEHVRDYRTFLANAFRALKPGGLLYLTTTTYFWTLFVLLVMYRRQVSLSALSEFVHGWRGDEESASRFVMRFWDFFTGHYHGFTLRQLERAARDAGFRVERLNHLHVQPVFPVGYLDQPYHGPHPYLVRAAVPPLKAFGSFVNLACKRLDLYAPNAVLVARRPSQ